jgi:hypothetical protein
MRYMLLIYDEETKLEKMSPSDRAAMHQEYYEFIADIQKDGAFLAGEPLERTNTATTVRAKNGKTITTDGPFAETKEQLGGYFIVEAKNLDEAMAIAARIPSVPRGGSVEVRPIREMDLPK